jgi:hypothetical protein
VCEIKVVGQETVERYYFSVSFDFYDLLMSFLRGIHKAKIRARIWAENCAYKTAF